jgi:hypothetical protein
MNQQQNAGLWYRCSVMEKPPVRLSKLSPQPKNVKIAKIIGQNVEWPKK